MLLLHCCVESRQSRRVSGGLPDAIVVSPARDAARGTHAALPDPLEPPAAPELAPDEAAPDDPPLPLLPLLVAPLLLPGPPGVPTLAVQPAATAAATSARGATHAT